MCLCSNACASIVDLFVLNLLYVDFIGMSQKIVRSAIGATIAFENRG